MVTLIKEQRGQLRLTKLPDHCERKGSLSLFSAGQNNTAISGLCFPLLSLHPFHSSPNRFGGHTFSTDESKQASVFRHWLVRHDTILPYRGGTSKWWNVGNPLNNISFFFFFLQCLIMVSNVKSSMVLSGKIWSQNPITCPSYCGVGTHFSLYEPSFLQKPHSKQNSHLLHVTVVLAEVHKGP